MASHNMGTTLFSLTSILLASSFFFAMTRAAPIPKTMDVESRESTLLLPTRDMWSEIAAVKPRYSTIDNLRIGTTILPTGRSSRILPRAPSEQPSAGIISRPIDSPAPSPVARRTLFPRYSIADNFKIGTVVRETGSVRSPLLPRMSAMEELERRTDLWKKATFDPKEPVQKRSSHLRENTPVGATKVFSGSLWRRGMKREVLA
ncbi:hypothetical protein B0O99DRAFT_687451 [Bisporella sp. PMI_857]|nr:hypothetical protein B0O99DRAFT_687451 [Bisporella sp. PMI_857]